MTPEIQKILKEPLVWVGAAVLCVPLLASSMLNKTRHMLTFESEPVSLISPSAESERKEVKLATTPRDSTKTDWKASNVPPLPPLPSSTSEKELREDSIVSLPPSKPDMSSSLDPGSLFAEMETYGQDDNEEVEKQNNDQAKADDQEFDFLFGEETKDDKETTSQEPEKSQGPKKVSGLPRKPQDGTPTWLFPEANADELTESENKATQLTERDPISSLPQDPSAFGSTGIYSGEPELVPMMPDRAVPYEVTGQPQEVFGEEMVSDYYLEVETGPDWWTPYCQQPFWGALPTQQTGLDAIVFAAMQNSPVVKLLNTEPQMAQTVVIEAEAQFDWAAFVETSWNDVNQPVVSLLDTGTAGGRFVQQQMLFESGVRKRLRTGGQLSVGQAWQRTDNNSIFLSPPDQATAQLVLDYRQPLLRGAGKHVNNTQVVLAEIGVEASHNGTQVLLQQFLVDVVAQFWELHFARGVLVQRMRSVERAEQLLHELSNRSDAGSWQRDLIRIQAAATARRTDLIHAQNMVASHQERLMNLTYGTGMPDPSSLEIVPMEAPGMYLLPYDLDFVTEMAVQNRPEVQVALTAIKASAVRQNLVLNDLKPRLDAIVSTFIAGVDENKDIGGAFGNAKDFDPSYSVGLSFEVPLGRRAANARVQRQQLDYQRLQHQLQQTLGNVRLDARLAYRSVQSLANELESHKLAVQQAGQELQLVTEKAATGLAARSAHSSLLVDDLLQSQVRLADAEGRLLRSQTDLSVALVEMKRATGQLLQTGPMPQVSGHVVQQANYEQSVESQNWAAPATEVNANSHSVLQKELWSD